MGILLRVLTIAVRLVLLLVSFVGWIVFVVGFVKLRREVLLYYTDPVNFPFGPEYAKTPLSLAHTLFIPMWVFVAAGITTYVPLALHILVCHENFRHILHSAFMFFNVFFLFGGSGTLLISMAFSMGKSAESTRGIVHFDKANSRTMFYGASLSIGLYWLSTFIWPLFNLKRKRKVFSYQPVNIQEDEEEEKNRWRPPPGSRKHYNNSGKFSTSRELYQQVSEEEGNYNWSE